eukprot:scaffold32483_cov18-Tisochrysis_lutea.AAC.1
MVVACQFYLLLSCIAAAAAAAATNQNFVSLEPLAPSQYHPELCSQPSQISLRSHFLTCAF